uniref:Uncharacterized protein n=1 Tax=Timema shepardi TaxID=629360 RepID=A0A7R9B1F5_TIMSH|nr:unnamed protein product [Timema shepardi]
MNNLNKGDQGDEDTRALVDEVRESTSTQSRYLGCDEVGQERASVQLQAPVLAPSPRVKVGRDSPRVKVGENSPRVKMGDNSPRVKHPGLSRRSSSVHLTMFGITGSCGGAKEREGAPCDRDPPGLRVTNKKPHLSFEWFNYKSREWWSVVPDDVTSPPGEEGKCISCVTTPLLGPTCRLHSAINRHHGTNIYRSELGLILLVEYNKGLTSFRLSKGLRKVRALEGRSHFTDSRPPGVVVRAHGYELRGPGFDYRLLLSL